MNKILFGLVLTFIVLPAWAQTRDESAAQCSGSDPDPSIVGCTALIKSGDEPKEVLVSAYYNRGSAYYRKRLYDSAILDYTHAIELNPDLSEPYNNRGSSYQKKGLYDLAIADFTKAISLEPRNVEAYRNRGLAYESSGQRDLAIADYRTAVHLAPDSLAGQEAKRNLRLIGATP